MDTALPELAFRFEVVIEFANSSRVGQPGPLCKASFAECDGLEMTMEPKVVRPGGRNTEVVHLVGPVTYSTLILKRGLTPSLELWKWFRAVTTSTARGETASGRVRLLGRDLQTARVEFLLEGCIPVKLKAPALSAKDGLLAIEEAHIAYQSLTVRDPAEGAA